MNIDRRQFLAGIFGTTISKLPIGNLPKEILDVIKKGGFPVDFTGIPDELFRKQMGKISRIDSEVVEKFLREREHLAQKCAQIGQNILGELGITKESGKSILVLRKTPQGNVNSPERILDRWGYPEMTWEEFFRWEGRHTIEGEFKLEDSIALPCSSEGVEATGSINLIFNPDGEKKLILHISKRALGMKSSSTEGIEIIVRNTQEIQRQIFDWKSRDWSQEIIKEHQEAKERFQKGFEKINQDKKRIRETKNINILKGSTFLTSPKETIRQHKNIKATVKETNQRIIFQIMT